MFIKRFQGFIKIEELNILFKIFNLTQPIKLISTDKI